MPEAVLAWLLKVPHFAGRRMADIRTEEIEDYLASRRTEARISANRELAFLKLVFKKAVQWGEIQANLTAAVSMTKEPETKIRVLTDEEARRLIASASGPIKPLLEVLLSTGLRKSEALCAQWEHPGWELDPKATIVSLEKRVIRVPGVIAKNHRTREVPLSGRLADLFRTLKATSKNGSVFGLRSFAKSFKSAAVKAGLKGLDDPRPEAHRGQPDARGRGGRDERQPAPGPLGSEDHDAIPSSEGGAEAGGHREALGGLRAGRSTQREGPAESSQDLQKLSHGGLSRLQLRPQRACIASRGCQIESGQGWHSVSGERP